MGIYTVYVEYRGGTYISQVQAETPAQALKKWCHRKPVPRGDVPSGVRHEIKGQVSAGDIPIRLRGLKNTWCTSGSYRRNFILINLVLTSPQQAR